MPDYRGLTPFEREQARKLMSGEITPDEFVSNMRTAAALNVIVFTIVLGGTAALFVWIAALLLDAAR